MEQQVKKDIYEIQMDAIRVKGERDGKAYDFLSFEGYDKKGKKCRFKFTKDCAENYDIPEEEGTYIFKINKKDINKDKQSRYSIYWVRAIESVQDFEGTFDNDEDLPF